MTLGEKLYILRTRQGMTQEQLAEKLQVSRQSISKWESDATRPDFDKLKFLAEFYHISLDHLLNDTIELSADISVDRLSDGSAIKLAKGSDGSLLEKTVNALSEGYRDSPSEKTDDSLTSGDVNHSSGRKTDILTDEVTEQSSDKTDRKDNAASNISSETIQQVTEPILEKTHIIWKRTTMTFGAICLALAVALIAVSVRFSNRLDKLSVQLAQQSAPIYVNNDSGDVSEQDQYFQNYAVTAESVSEDAKYLHVKFTAVLKNYQDNTILTLQLKSETDQRSIPVSFTCDNNIYIGYADMPINADKYSVTACIDTDGSKQTVNLSQYDQLSVLALTDWQPNLECTGNMYNKATRYNEGDFMITCQEPVFASYIKEAQIQILNNGNEVYSYQLSENMLSSFSEETPENFISYNFKLPKEGNTDAYTIKFSWYNSFLKQYVTYETKNNGVFDEINSDNANWIIFNFDEESQPVTVTFSR